VLLLLGSGRLELLCEGAKDGATLGGLRLVLSKRSRCLLDLGGFLSRRSDNGNNRLNLCLFTSVDDVVGVDRRRVGNCETLV
jgi:hypothetical protein